MTELMANRIEEIEYEVSYPTAGHKINLAHVISPFFLQSKLSQAEESIKKCLAIFEDEKLDLSDEEWYSYSKELQQSQTEKTRLTNVQALLKQIMEAYRGKKITLLPVTREMLVRVSERLQEDRGSSQNHHFLENWSVYFHILNKVKRAVQEQVILLEDKLLERSKEFKEIENHGYGLLLKKAKFVGMATTGAAKYNSILHMMKAKMGIPN